MPNNYSIWGKDKFKIEDTYGNFIADKSIVKLSYESEPTEIVNSWSGEIIYINQKYRETMEVTIKQFLNNGWYWSLRNLVNILKRNNFTIYPFYQSEMSNNFELTNMIHINGVSFTQLTELVESGQSIVLKFKGKIPISKNYIPTSNNKPMIFGYEAGRGFYE